MTMRFTLPMIAVAGLAACEQPAENTLSRADVLAFAADDDRVSTLDFAATDSIPTGAATYTGHVRSDAILNGDADYIVAGNLQLDIIISDTATQGGTGTLTGSITDLNLFDNNNDGFEDQAFDGDLTVSGRATSGRIDASATGNLGAVLSDTITQDTSTWNLDLDGDLYDDNGSADVAAGTFSGGTDNASNDDYTIQLETGGMFYAERE